jgi:serine/threonine-protein kinase
LKDYDVIAPLTEGGMATLMLARRRGVGGFSRLVALKLVHSHLTQDSAMIKLFLDEARISAHVVHPNVVHVEEVGVEGGNYFIAMEYVHGVSLARLLKRLSQDRRRMAPTLAVCLAAQVAEALHAAHEAVGEQGTPLHIVHRDVSPQNILIAHSGHVKLIDFGIAKSRAALHESRTGAGVLGKLRYMAPEQIQLQAVDRRTDIYALGVVLWEMLTARNLLRCHRIDDPRDEAIRMDPPPPSRYASLVKPALDKVVLRALAPNPEDRYSTALELRRALLKAQQDAARVDAPKVASMLRAAVGEDLELQAARLPDEITRALVEPVPREEREEKSLFSELTLPMAVQDNTDPTDALRAERPTDSDSRPRMHADKVSTLAAPSVSPSQAEQLLRRHKQQSNMLVIAVGSLCLTIGLWIGRTTAPSMGREPANAPPTASVRVVNPQSVAQGDVMVHTEQARAESPRRMEPPIAIQSPVHITAAEPERPAAAPTTLEVTPDVPAAKAAPAPRQRKVAARKRPWARPKPKPKPRPSR